MKVGGIEILQRGDLRLQQRCAEVGDVREELFRRQRDRLHAALAAFRAEHGFGRAIAAPQIGVARRFVAVHLDGVSTTLVDPRITARSPETFTLWDDCLSFPSLLVRVRRHRRVDVDFVDGETGQERRWRGLDEARSELLQHELDHLDGVLAVDRAEGEGAIVSRADFEADRPRYVAMVDRPPHF